MWRCSGTASFGVFSLATKLESLGTRRISSCLKQAENAGRPGSQVRNFQLDRREGPAIHFEYLVSHDLSTSYCFIGGCFEREFFLLSAWTRSLVNGRGERRTDRGQLTSVEVHDCLRRLGKPGKSSAGLLDIRRDYPWTIPDCGKFPLAANKTHYQRREV